MKAHVGSKPVMTVHRRILKKKTLVYLLVGRTAIRYADGRSRVVYIGTTSKGASRIAKSAAFRAEQILAQRGFRNMDVYVVTCPPVGGLKSWIQLEKALLAAFRGLYHEKPLCNQKGNRYRWNKKLSKHFSRDGLENILLRFDPSRKPRRKRKRKPSRRKC